VVVFLLLLGTYFTFRTETEDLDRAARESAPGEFIQLPGGMVHYQLEGPVDGPLVILVHGFSVPLYVWEPTALELIGQGFKVLRYDLYGRGYSDRVQDNYDQDLFVKQLEEMVVALEISEPFALVGLSMGGPIAARYSHLHPEKVSGLVLIAPEVKQTKPKDIFPLNLPLVGDYLMAAVMEPLVLPKLQPSDFFHPQEFPQWEDRYRDQLKYRGTGRALLSTIRSLTEFDPAAEYRLLQETDVPVLLVWGWEDKTIGNDQVSALQDLLPEMEITLVEGAGHLPHYEKPTEVNAALIEFFQRLDPEFQ
jgi:pimeloyl-ACP methyl ester carboxylesterase